MQDQAPLKIESLVSATLTQETFAGFSDTLKSIAEALNAYGCILWQITTDPSSTSRSGDGQLFVLSEWFRDNHTFAFHDLPLNNSVTGEAALRHVTINIDDIWDDERVYKADPFLSKVGIKVMCSVPISFRDGARGALNLYRNVNDPFSESEVTQMERLAALVPPLYQAIRDEVSLGLITKVDELLRAAETRSEIDPLINKDLSIKRDEKAVREEVSQEVLNTICELVAGTFQCIETSIVLEDRFKSPGVYKLMSTTWKGPIKKPSYRKEDRGLTAWVLKHAKPVRLFDLAHFERDEAMIRSEYPDISWTDSLNLMQADSNLQQRESQDELTPLSFMAVPIHHGKRVYGVIRCSVANRGPHYFADRDLVLLDLVASQISRFWSYWISRLEWKALVNNIGILNSFVYKQLTRTHGDVKTDLIFDEALRVTNQVIDGAEILDVRLLDEKERVLRFVRTYGKAWKEGGEKEYQNRLGIPFDVDERPPRSAGAFVFQQGITYPIADVRQTHFYHETFRSVTRMIVTPIRVKNDIIGVLDIRGTGEGEFPKYANQMAELLGQQIGMYSYLATTISELHSTEVQLKDKAKKLESLKNQQIQTFQDSTHQFKTPIISALRWVEQALNDANSDDLKKQLRAVRGLCNKALRVSLNMKLFSDLAQGKQIQADSEWLPLEDLMKLLKEANMDTLLLVPPHRDIKFFVDEQSFMQRRGEHFSGPTALEADLNMLEQAISDILDNAAKYSWPSTTVRVFGGWTSSSGFHISVENQGIQIRRDEAAKCKVRGWQSELAEDVKGQGTGIGLWLVDNIMRAHQGTLEIVPTDTNNFTQVRLIFPAKRVR